MCAVSLGVPAFIPTYITRFWQMGDGLPGNNVTSVAQTWDGYLWLGTRSGLARFDGVRFVVFDSSNTPEMQSPHVTCLFEASDGTLWIGHENGELTCYQGGVFHEVPVHAAWRGGKIFGIGEDRSGNIWIMNQDAELVRVKDGFVIPPPSVRTTYLLAFVNNPRGGFWVQRDNEVAALRDGELRPLPMDDSSTNRYVQGIGASRDGGLWIVTENRVRKWKNGAWAADFGPTPWGATPLTAILETSRGLLAAATSDHGLYLVSPGKSSVHFCRTNNFPEDWVTSLCEDREGNLWAGTGNGGLAMLRPGNITTLSPPDRWQGRAILSVACDKQGALWVGTEGAGLYRYSDGVWTNFDSSAGLRNGYVWSVMLDANGRAWAGTWGGGLFVQNGTQFEIPLELRNLAAPVPALLALPDGGLLAGTGVGLLRFDEGKLTWLARRPELASPDVRAVVKAADGTIWFGMSGGGLGRYKHGTLRQFRRSDGLSSDFVLCLHLDQEGALWIGTFGGGLDRLKNGRFSAVTMKQGLANDVICDIQDDGLGYYWISSHGGIMRIRKAELERCADGETDQVQCLAYGLSDGLPTLQCSGGFQPAAGGAKDGRLWFPTSQGLVAVDPHEVTTNLLAPRVIIEKILVDGQTVAEHRVSEAPLEIAPGRQRFEFQFTGLSFVAPEKVRFRYRLEGLEDQWTEVQSPRLAIYSHLMPGDYQFHVRACNNDGIWDEAGASLAFTVLPAFWQMWWFRSLGGALTALAGGAVVWLGSRRRMRLKLERLERQQSLERERARIAKDIHDDLGAGLTRISLLSGTVPPEEVSPRPAAEALNRIFQTTHEMTEAMDEIVWALNPQHDTLDSLASYLGRFAQDFLAGGDVRCRLDVPFQLPNWPLDAEVRHNLFLSFKESLNNVLRHAGATEVRVFLATHRNAFTVTVEDNGKGFATDTASPVASAAGRIAGRNGLANMRQRLAQIGGRCVIRSVPGSGTGVEFVVPVKPGAG